MQQSTIKAALQAACLFAFARAQNTDCSGQAPLPLGNGPVPSPDTVVSRVVENNQISKHLIRAKDAFYSLQSINDAANNAALPPGYTSAYTNLHATSNAVGYLGYFALTTYNVTECASRCNASDRCTAFNIAFERDPSVEPTAPDGTCPQPPSTNTIKCVLWSGPVSTSNAVNTGEYRQSFHVVIAGSNGYNKQTPPSLAGYTGPSNLANYAINVNQACADGTRPGMRQLLFQPGDPYDVTACAAACTAASTCQFFNAFILTRDNGAQFGQICNLFRSPWGNEFATQRRVSFDGPPWAVSSSFSYAKVGAPAQCAASVPAMA